MLEVEIEDVRKKIHSSYRRRMATLKSSERKFLAAPTEELRCELSEQRGFLAGLMRALDFLEHKANDNELDFQGKETT